FLWLALIAMALVGAASITFMAQGNSTLQLAADPSMRGRVMALYAVAFLGSTPIGGPITGFVGDVLGGRAALTMGALACLAAAAIGTLLLRRVSAGEPPTGACAEAAGLDVAPR